MKHLVIFISLLLTAQLLRAQNTHFTTNGTIEFEKSINMYAVITKQITKENEAYLQPAFEAYKRTHTQFKKLKSTLTFSKDKTLFKPLPDESITGNSFFGEGATVGQNNTTFTDLVNNSSVTQKTVYDELFLVKDSTRKINWKITDETRDIAGYTCRRANALIMDSIYVVAFYTDEIPVSGGPESFTGLPGMILGIALPHENMTWFATKVTDIPILPTAVVPPTKGKAVNNKQLRATLEAALKNWGDYAKPAFKAYLL